MRSKRNDKERIKGLGPNNLSMIKTSQEEETDLNFKVVC